MGFKNLLRAGVWVLRYHLGGEIQSGFRDAISTLEGKLECTLRDRTRQFYYGQIQGRERPGALKTLKVHRNRGHRVVLLTSASSYLAEVVAENLSLDGFLSTEFEVDESGYFTGKPKEPLCYGMGKFEIARRYLGANRSALEDAYFYTDSMSDIHVLTAVGNPVVVNPDPRLRERAKQQGWPVMDWGEPI